MKRLFLVVVATLMAAPALAEDGKFYGGVSFGSAKVQDFCDGAAALGISCDDGSNAVRLFGGVQASQGVSLELGYVDFGKVGGSFGPYRIDVSATAFDVSGLFGVPLGSNGALYSRLGLYHGSEKVSSNVGIAASASSTNLTFGVGARLDLAPNFGLRLDWQRYAKMGDSQIGESDVDFISFGGLFRF